MDIDEYQSDAKRRKLAPVIKKSSMDQMLARWGATKSPTSVSKMARAAKSAFSYAESPPTSPDVKSDASAYEDVSGMMSDAVETDGAGQSEDELNQDDVIHVLPRGTAARLAAERQAGPPKSRELPTRSTRANISYVSPSKYKKPRSKKHLRKSVSLLTSDTVPGAVAKFAKPETLRSKARANIALHTKPKRDAFLLANKEYFQPLLPGNNYISKLERQISTAEGIPYTKLTHQPLGVTATMKPYQLDGLSFLVHMYENGVSSILGDEMGLGKTLQTLSLFQYLAENHPTTGENRPNLVVCPLSVLSSWVAEAKRWVPGLKVLRMHGPKAERARIMKGFLARKSQESLSPEDRVDLVVTTYDTFKAEHSWFKRVFVWRYCVLDEGHQIKNDKSDISTSLQGLGAEYRLLLTGTPLQNNLTEMWALLHWLFPEVFTADTSDSFKRAFDLTRGTVSTTFLDDSRRLLELIMLRRMKSSPEVNLGLPPKEEVLLYVPLTPMQRFWYTRLLTRVDNATLNVLFANAKSKEEQDIKREADESRLFLLEKAGAAVDTAAEIDTKDVWAESREIMEEAIRNDQVEKQSKAWQKLMNLLMQLRKVCTHPYLLQNAAPPVYDIGDHIKSASGKFIVLEKLIDELVLKQGKKVLIFSGFTKVLDLVGELLQLKGAHGHNPAFRFARLDGRSQRAQRNLSIRLFNDMKSDYNVMLLSTRAGGLGINLTSASDVVFMDEDWNPQVTVQAEARAHRIGQTRKVTVYKLCSQGTVEEQMMGRIRKKLYLSAKITESMRSIHSTELTNKKRKRQSVANTADDNGPHLNTASLQSLIRRGAQTLASSQVDVNEILKWDWETVLENCRDKTADALLAVQDNTPDEQEWLNSVERVECAVFEGKRHQKEIERKAEEIMELNRLDRRAGKNTTVEIDGFMISKESLNCGDWEAVPTFAGKDPSLAEPKREKKAKVLNQSFCQCCWQDGQLVYCSGCPRSYHQGCISKDFQSKASFGMFYCSQHECRDCGAKTSDAGGMIYRCRWCENGYCEDCIDWDSVNLVGPSLPEFELLSFGAVSQAYFVDCPLCIEHWQGDKEARRAMETAKARYEREYAEEMGNPMIPEAATSDADRTPDTISEVATPVEALPVDLPSSLKKIKLDPLYSKRKTKLAAYPRGYASDPIVIDD